MRGGLVYVGEFKGGLVIVRGLELSVLVLLKGELAEWASEGCVFKGVKGAYCVQLPKLPRLY